MENYLLVNNYGKSNTPDRIYYIMTRSDLPNLIKEESVVFGDKAYILEEGTMMFMGNDGIWYDTEGEVPVITAKELNVTENGTYIDSDPYVAYRPVNVQVTDYNVEELNVTENGTYSESGKAYSPVIVNVPLPENAYLKKDLPTGAIATVTDAETEFMPSLKVAITPVQSGSGDPSPDNIRPISGWTGAKITKTAENLFGSDRWFGIGGTDNVEGRTVTGGSQASSIPFLSNLGGYTFKENTIYTLIITMKSTATNGRPCISFVYTDGTSEQLKNDSIGTTKGSYAFSSNPNKTIDYIGRASYSGTKIYYVDECGVFEGALTADDFEPYTGQDYTIPFPSEAGTVYGGTLDVTNGTLTVDRQFYTFDGSENWTLITSTSATQYTCINLGSKQIYKNDTEDVSYSLFSHYKTVPITTSDENIGARILFSTSQKKQRICVRQEIGMTTTELKTYLEEQYSAGTPVQCCAVLLEPITYQLTPTEIQMLLGTNNIWADTGDILEGKYWSKNPVTVTRAMLNTLRGAGEITEITPEEPEELEEPEENDER